MGPGFIRGVIVGAAVSALALSVVSLSVPLPAPPVAGTDAPTAGGGQAPASDSVAVTGPGRDGDLVELPPTAPERAETGEPQGAALEQSVTTPAAVPQVGGNAGALASPQTPAPGTNVAVETGNDLPVAPPQAAPPAAPADKEVELSISTEPAQPAIPDVAAETTFPPAPDVDATPKVDSTSDPALAAGGQGDGTRPASADQASPSDLPSVTAQAAIPDIGGPASGLDAPDGTDPSAGFAPADGGQNADTSPQAPRGAAPSSATAEAAPSLSTRSADAPTVAAGPGGFASPLPSEEAAAPSAPADMPAPAAISGQGSPAVSEPDVGSAGAVPKVATAPAAPLEPVQQPAEPRLAALPQIGMDRPSTASPRNHTIGSRLPGRKQAETPPEPEIEQAPSEPPIVANAEPFENPDDKPLMSIILIDEPGSIGAEALADFPYPLTFALDPTAPGAVEKMKAHRAVGFEVVAMVDFPPTAQPSDAEVSMSVWLDTINQAVAVLEGPNSGFQGNRPVADQVTEIVAQEGYGLITLDNGLNTVQKLAARRGVPSTVVFRDFDGAGQTPTVMRRFLDQAAFRAGQRGAVVMLGRVRPDTVSALLLWGLQDRANRVALAPISAILTAGTR